MIFFGEEVGSGKVGEKLGFSALLFFSEEEIPPLLGKFSADGIEFLRNSL